MGGSIAFLPQSSHFHLCTQLSLESHGHQNIYKSIEEDADTGNAEKETGTMEMTDVMVHIDEEIDHGRRTQIADTVREHKGVMAVAHHDEKPHLLIIEYDPRRACATDRVVVNATCL